ncbi:SOS response-associated peptidase [Ileibacterium valens]|uniref:SOS response-associated peptidase n=1 Tax=Ileibacterium valens TaxID=1862668 RepID=UPI0024BADDEA|nr:SOS response-associated peptidase family protein [Ileibacterium valens]
MCGRFLMNEEALAAVENFVKIPRSIQGQLDLGMIFPSNPSLVIYEDGNDFKAGIKHFGFLSEKLKKRIINARAETIEEKWMFKNAFHHQRCVIPCALFYEWNSAKERISFTENGHPVMYLAGIWMKDDFVILTTEANSSMERFHHRMPLILTKEQSEEWILNYSEASKLLDIIPPALRYHIDTPKQATLF